MTTEPLVPHTGESTPPPVRFPLVDGRASLEAEVAGARDTDAPPLSTVERRSVTTGFRPWGPSELDVASGVEMSGARSSGRDSRRVAFTVWSVEPCDVPVDAFDSKYCVNDVSDRPIHVNSRQRPISDSSSCDERKSSSVERAKSMRRDLRRTSGYGSMDRTAYEKLDGDVIDHAGISRGIRSIGLPTMPADDVCSVEYPTVAVHSDYADTPSTEPTGRNKFVTVRRRPDVWTNTDLMAFDSDVEQASTTPVRSRRLSGGNNYDTHHVEGPVSSGVTVKSVVVKPESSQYRPSQFDPVNARNSVLELDHRSAKLQKETVESDSDDEPLVKVKSRHVNRKKIMVMLLKMHEFMIDVGLKNLHATDCLEITLIIWIMMIALIAVILLLTACDI